MTTQQPARVILPLLAGSDNQGQPVVERLPAQPQAEKNRFQVLHSPLLVRGLAADDLISLDLQRPGEFRVVQRSGKLALRVFRRDNLEDLAQALTPQVEKLEGSLDVRTELALVYSLHVNLGFAAIEALFDNAMADFPGSVWYYGNVYDPRDGVTPLQWWDAFLNTV